MTFRKIIFWAHLVAGVISGLAIGAMCFTGTVLAFEKEIVAWSERDARRVTPPSENATRLPLDELQRRFRAAQPEARTASLVLQNDAHAAIAFSAGRTGGFYVDPYNGEIRQPKSTAVAPFMQKMTAWHRSLGFTGATSRPRARLVNGVCNIAFCLLAITGLYLWMPRSWSWRALKPGVWFRQNSSGKARDFNWHNVIGFWAAPVLIVLTLTAIPISFQWGGRVISSLTGTPVSTTPAGPGVGGGGAGPAIEVPAPPAGTPTLSQDALIARVQKEVPEWRTITVTVRGGSRGDARPGARNGPETPAAAAPAAGVAPAATFTVRSSDSWPRTANLTLSLNPYTGDVLRRTGYADQAAAQQVRSWTRFLHTGEALGKVGQFVAGLACLGGCFLVYTGFALSWRRFFGGGSIKATPTPSHRV